MLALAEPVRSTCPHCGARTARRSGVSVRVAAVVNPAGGVMGPHEHETPRLVVVLRGRYDERLGASRRRDCRPATALFRPAGERHIGTFDHEDVRYVSIVLPNGFADDGGPSMRKRFETSFELTDSAVAVLGTGLAHEVWSADGAAPIALEGLALELVAQLALRGAGRTEPAPHWIGAAREMIAAQYDAVTPGAIARAFDLDASYVARAFRMHVGRTLGDEIRAVRIARAARRFVAEPAAVLAEVAAEAGFFDQSHFSRVFKRVVGVTPRHYRELDRATRSALARSKPS